MTSMMTRQDAADRAQAVLAARTIFGADAIDALTVEGRQLLVDDIRELARDEHCSAHIAACVLHQRIGGPSNLPAYVATLRAGARRRASADRWVAWQLADDQEAYGADAGRFIITTADGEHEIQEYGVMDEADAVRIVNDHNANLRIVREDI